MRRTVLQAIAAATLLWSGAYAQAPPSADSAPTVDRFQDWVLSCVPGGGDQEACSILQDRRGADGRRQIATEIRLEDDGTPIAILLLPFGLSLQSEIVTRIGQDAPLGRTRILTCLPNGCIATFPITPGLLDRMRAGRTMVVELSSVSGEPLRYRVSLMGLTAALSQLSDRIRS